MKTVRVALSIAACIGAVLLASGCSASSTPQAGAGTSAPVTATTSAASASPAVSELRTPSAAPTKTPDNGLPDCDTLSFIGKLKAIAGPSATLTTNSALASGPNGQEGYQIKCQETIGKHENMTVADLQKMTVVLLSVRSAFIGNCTDPEFAGTPDPSAPGSFVNESSDGIQYTRCTGKNSDIVLTVSHGPANGVSVSKAQAAELASAVQADMAEVNRMGAVCATVPSPCH